MGRQNVECFQLTLGRFRLKVSRTLSMVSIKQGEGNSGGADQSGAAVQVSFHRLVFRPMRTCETGPLAETIRRHIVSTVRSFTLSAMATSHIRMCLEMASGLNTCSPPSRKSFAKSRIRKTGFYRARYARSTVVQNGDPWNQPRSYLKVSHELMLLLTCTRRQRQEWRFHLRSQRSFRSRIMSSQESR